MMITPPVTVVIPVLNEAANLAGALESLREYEYVFVVDSGSTDDTRKIAEAFGREVVDFKWDGHFPKKRNWFLRHHAIPTEWVLFLDADERMTPAFTAELCAFLPGTRHNGFWVFYDTWFMGRMLRHGDRARKLCLLRAGHGEYEKIDEDRWSALDMEVHEHLLVDGSVGRIASRLEHHDRRDLKAYYARHNEYSSWEARRFDAFLISVDQAQLTPRQKIKYALLANPLFPLMYFIASYLLKGGFLDGKEGFMFGISKLIYFHQVQFKLKELKNKRLCGESYVRG